MMEKASQLDTAPTKEKMSQSHPLVTSTSLDRASLLGEASRILVTLGVARLKTTQSIVCILGSPHRKTAWRKSLVSHSRRH